MHPVKPGGAMWFNSLDAAARGCWCFLQFNMFFRSPCGYYRRQYVISVCTCPINTFVETRTFTHCVVVYSTCKRSVLHLISMIVIVRALVCKLTLTHKIYDAMATDTKRFTEAWVMISCTWKRHLFCPFGFFVFSVLNLITTYYHCWIPWQRSSTSQHHAQHNILDYQDKPCRQSQHGTPIAPILFQ